MHSHPNDRTYGVAVFEDVFLWHQLPIYRADSSAEEIVTPPEYVTGVLPPIEYGTDEDQAAAKRYNLHCAYVIRRTEKGQYRHFIKHAMACLETWPMWQIL